eukprot:6730014-Heterocapsa_arctica.AAC.1
MYTHRGQLAAGVTKQEKLRAAAAFRGLEHKIVLPTVSPAHANKPNALSIYIQHALDNPGVALRAAPKVRTEAPAHILRAQAKVNVERSRSAPAPRP